MKICHVAKATSFSGSENHLLPLAAHPYCGKYRSLLVKREHAPSAYVAVSKKVGVWPRLVSKGGFKEETVAHLQEPGYLCVCEMI